MGSSTQNRAPRRHFSAKLRFGFGVERLEGIGELIHEALQRLCEQLIHRAEVVVDEPVIHSGGFGQCPGGNARVAHLVEKVLGGVHQRAGRLLARLGNLFAAPRHVPSGQRKERGKHLNGWNS